MAKVIAGSRLAFDRLRPLLLKILADFQFGVYLQPARTCRSVRAGVKLLCLPLAASWRFVGGTTLLLIAGTYDVEYAGLHMARRWAAFKNISSY